MLFASAASVLEAAEGLLATICVAMLDKVTPAGAEPGEVMREVAAVDTASANCAGVAAVWPSWHGIKQAYLRRQKAVHKREFVVRRARNAAPRRVLLVKVSGRRLRKGDTRSQASGDGHREQCRAMLTQTGHKRDGAGNCASMNQGAKERWLHGFCLSAELGQNDGCSSWGRSRHFLPHFGKESSSVEAEVNQRSS